MKTISIDGIEYVTKEDYDLLKKSKKNKMRFLHDKMPFEPSHVMALGSVVLEGDWASAMYSVSLLRRAVESFEALGIESVSLTWATDYPVVLGEVSDGKASGIVIAPRIRGE